MARIKKQMKGKSKKAKKNETEHEMQLRLEIERMKDEEAARARDHKRRKLLKDKMALEAKLSAVNRLKIDTQWRKLLRLLKVEELRDDIEVLSQGHERQIDRKDALIEALDADLDAAEEQHQVAVRSHQRTVDRLIDVHNARVKVLRGNFESELRTLVDEFRHGHDEVGTSFARRKKELLDCMALMEKEAHEKELDARQEYESAREEIKNRSSEEYNVLRFTLEGLIEELERHFDSAHASYVSSTENRMTDYKALTLRDTQSARTIDQQSRRLQRLHDSVLHWKSKLGANAKEYEDRNRALRGEKEALARHFQELKGRMNGFRDAEERRLRDLTLQSQGAIGTLRKRLAKAERILKLAELNRAMETEREKVLPFYKSSVEEEAAAAASTDEMVSSLKADAAAADAAEALAEGGKPMPGLEEWDYLGNFFKRHNKVLLDVKALEQERERIRRENADLRSILKQYLDGISVNEDVISAPNPLLVVNNRNAIVPAARLQQPPARPSIIIEAAHVVRQPAGAVASGR